MRGSTFTQVLEMLHSLESRAAGNHEISLSLYVVSATLFELWQGRDCDFSRERGTATHVAIAHALDIKVDRLRRVLRDAKALGILEITTLDSEGPIQISFNKRVAKLLNLIDWDEHVELKQAIRIHSSRTQQPPRNAMRLIDAFVLTILREEAQAGPHFNIVQVGKSKLSHLCRVSPLTIRNVLNRLRERQRITIVASGFVYSSLMGRVESLFSIKALERRLHSELESQKISEVTPLTLYKALRAVINNNLEPTEGSRPVKFDKLVGALLKQVKEQRQAHRRQANETLASLPSIEFSEVDIYLLACLSTGKQFDLDNAVSHLMFIATAAAVQNWRAKPAEMHSAIEVAIASKPYRTGKDQRQHQKDKIRSYLSDFKTLIPDEYIEAFSGSGKFTNQLTVRLANRLDSSQDKPVGEIDEALLTTAHSIYRQAVEQLLTKLCRKLLVEVILTFSSNLNSLPSELQIMPSGFKCGSYGQIKLVFNHE